ncbi:alpha/beta hydrolase [Micromonospora sp. M12]
MFDGFDEFDISTSGSTIHGRRGGSGPPVLLLHGIPETHLMWHRVAPRLAENYTVVATDLRGWGDSGKPGSSANHEPYGMRAVARDQVEVMRSLGYEKFHLVGHDRGARCAYRLALDEPDVVTRLAVMDVVPIGDVYDRADKTFSLSYWVWSFLAAPEPVPEQFIAAAPAVLVDFMLDTWPKVKDAFPAEVRAAYVKQFSDPPPFTRSARSSARPRHWTTSRTRRTAETERSPARCCSSGANRVRSRSSTTTRSRSGGSGPTTYAASRYRSAISFPRRHPRRPHGSSWTS